MRSPSTACLRVLLAASLGYTTLACADPACDMADDGDCCTSDADCAAAVNAALCAVVPINNQAAAKAGEYDESASLCSAKQIERLRREASALGARCRQHACKLVLPEGR